MPSHTQCSLFANIAEQHSFLGLKKNCRVALFRTTQNLAKFGSGFFFFFLYSNFNFYCKFVTKLATFSTGSFSLVVRIVLNSSVFRFHSKKSALTIWLSSFAMHILFGGSDFHSRYMYMSFKKKDFRPTDPTLKFYPQKGNTTFFFIWPYCQCKR